MTEAELARFRRRIGDGVKSEVFSDNVFESQTVFTLKYRNIISITVWVNNVEVASSDYTLNAETGVVIFTDPIPADTKIQMNYTYTAYSDSDIEAIVDDVGFDQGVLEVLRELMADSARLYDYSQGATDAKLSQIFKQLKVLYDTYSEEINNGGYGKAKNRVMIGSRTTPEYREKQKVYKIDLSRMD